MSDNFHFKYTGGRTNTAAALSLVQRFVFGFQGDRPDVPDLTIVFTDGRPYYNYVTVILSI